MIDESQLPPAVAEHLADLRRQIAACNDAIKLTEQETAVARADCREAEAAEAAILRTAEAFILAEDVTGTAVRFHQPISFRYHPAPLTERRERQNRREVLLRVMSNGVDGTGWSIGALAHETGWPPSQVTKQLARLGDQVRESGGLWYRTVLAAGPPANPGDADTIN